MYSYNFQTTLVKFNNHYISYFMCKVNIIIVINRLRIYRIDDKLRIRIGDFGVSVDLYSSKYFQQGEEFSVKLPVKWMALESLLNRIFSEKTDVVSD